MTIFYSSRVCLKNVEHFNQNFCPFEACRIEFDHRLRQHYNWQDRVARQQSVTGFTSYESYAKGTLQEVRQRYFKLSHVTTDNGLLRGRTEFYSTKKIYQLLVWL